MEHQPIEEVMEPDEEEEEIVFKKRKKSSRHKKNTKTKKHRNTALDDFATEQDQEEKKEEEEDVKLAIPIAKSIAHPDSVCWAIFPDISPLTSMIAVLESLLDEAPLTFIGPGHECEMTRDTQQKLVSLKAPKTTFSGFYFKCIDKSHTCLVVGKLAAQVVICSKAQPEDTTVTVPMNVFASHLRSIDGSSSVQLYTTAVDAKLMIKSSSSLQSSHFRTMAINTTASEQDTFDISGISYDFTIEFDLRTFQKILRTAKIIKSDFIRLRVLALPDEHSRTFLVINTHGACSSDEHVFCSNTMDTKDKHIIVVKSADTVLDIRDSTYDPANVEASSLVCKYSGLFATEYLNNFTCNLEQPTLLIRVSADVRNPMIITSYFGDEHSFVTFVLSSKEEAEAFPDTLGSFKAS